MGFFSWLFCSILVVALVLLLFPFSVRIEFEAGERGARALFFFFKKKVYEYEKKWGLGGDDKCVDRESRPSSLGHDRDQHLRQERSDCPKTKEGEEQERSDCPKDSTDSSSLRHPEPRKGDGSSNVEGEHREAKVQQSGATATAEKAEPKAEAKDSGKSEEKKEAVVTAEAKAPSTMEKKAAPAKPAEKPVAKSETEKPKPEAESPKSEEPAAKSEPEQEQPKKEKRKLSDREFWTILLTPDLDARAFKYVLKILGSVFSLFRMRFMDCFVEGIRTDYQSMGYIAAVNGFMKAYPYVGDWDLRMDWCHEKELRAAGAVRVSISLLRIFCFILETLVLAGILAFSFWRRRARVLKTNKLPEIGFVRKKIVDFIVEE